MADYRTANPEYQLDVDTMMVEYAAYWAVDAKLKALKIALDIATAVPFTRTDAKVMEKSAEAHNAERLVQIFDTLINLFYHNHQTATVSPGTTFNINILEFLVLLGHFLHREPQSESQRGPMQHQRLLNSKFRRKWLHAWCCNSQTHDDNLKHHIASLEESNNISNDTYDKLLYDKTDNPYVELNDVMTWFLDLSAEVSNSIGPVNEQWYSLAAETMLNCAIERGLYVSRESPSLSPSETSSLMTRWTSECFAWGAVSPCPFEEDLHSSNATDMVRDEKLHEQISIRDMFRLRNDSSSDGDGNLTKVEEDNDTNGDSQMTDASTSTPTPGHIREDPTWTTTRDKAHARVISLFHSTDLTNPKSAALKLANLQETSSMLSFVRRLRDFVDGIWCLNMDNISGKPVLVQIEEGGITGMSDAEFHAFLAKVGLKTSPGGRGGKGVGVKWAR